MMTDSGGARLSRPSNGQRPEVGRPEQNGTARERYALIYMKMESTAIRLYQEAGGVIVVKVYNKLGSL